MQLSWLTAALQAMDVDYNCLAGFLEGADLSGLTAETLFPSPLALHTQTNTHTLAKMAR